MLKKYIPFQPLHIYPFCSMEIRVKKKKIIRIFYFFIIRHNVHELSTYKWRDLKFATWSKFAETTLIWRWGHVQCYQIWSWFKAIDFTNPCENTTCEIQINTTIPQLDQGKKLDASIRRSLVTSQHCLKLSARDMDTRLYRWFSNQGNYRRRRWYHHPVSQWCNIDCQFCHRKALYQL